MVYTLIKYSEKFPHKGKQLSRSTIMRRCSKGMLPTNHIATRLPGKRGQWIIEVLEKKDNK